MTYKFLRVLVIVLAIVVLAGGLGAVWARATLRGSLPQLEGERQLRGLVAPVEITRDHLGIPSVRAANRADAARATGFLHAQDRFFQMDLSRRRAAGELAALVGPPALILDREIRIHRFRAQARRAVTLLKADDRALLEAYTAGVNAGLQALDASPFEYLLLRQNPVLWSPEDTLLVVLSMFITLQDPDGEYEATLATMRDVLPQPVFDFLAPRGSEWDTPLVGGAFEMPPLPGPEVYDLRTRRKNKPQIPNPAPQNPDRVGLQKGFGLWALGSGLSAFGFRRWDLGLGTWDLSASREEGAIGSNSFAVAGRLTADGRPLIANDMHLRIRVPNTWFRAVLEWPDTANPAEPHRLAGVTLPGVPAVVVGSNTHVAWGFTNTYADWSDVILLDVDPRNPSAYLTPEGWRPFDRYNETISVAGEADEQQTVLWTIWGPLLPPDHRGRPRAYRWVAHSAERLAASIAPLESARTLEDAFEESNGLGTPGQNIVVAEREGRIGWSVYGAIPRRTGFDGRLPVSWADGSRGWSGWLADDEYPRVIDPPNGRIWTANARVVDGEMLAKLGDGSYEIGSRARIIRDRLTAKERFGPQDLLDIQLDTNATFLARWRSLLLTLLTPDATHDSRDRVSLRAILDEGWSGQVSPDSAAYRFTRSFRELLSKRVIGFVLSECYEADPTFDYTMERRREAAIWTLVSEQPHHLLDPQYETWNEMLLSAVDETIEEATRDRDGELRDRVWSEYNVTVFRHPLSGGVPLIGRWLDMPDAALPGDLYTPRVHWGAIGASERMIVSPGHEADGIMHMPTGQSGHPLSPFYANSHADWVEGKPTPFLPGPPVHMLMLRP